MPIPGFLWLAFRESRGRGSSSILSDIININSMVYLEYIVDYIWVIFTGVFNVYSLIYLEHIRERIQQYI